MPSRGRGSRPPATARATTIRPGTSHHPSQPTRLHCKQLPTHSAIPPALQTSNPFGRSVVRSPHHHPPRRHHHHPACPLTPARSGIPPTPRPDGLACATGIAARAIAVGAQVQFGEWIRMGSVKFGLANYPVRCGFNVASCLRFWPPSFVPYTAGRPTVSC